MGEVHEGELKWTGWSKSGNGDHDHVRGYDLFLE